MLCLEERSGAGVVGAWGGDRRKEGGEGQGKGSDGGEGGKRRLWLGEGGPLRGRWRHRGNERSVETEVRGGREKERKQNNRKRIERGPKGI